MVHFKTLLYAFGIILLSVARVSAQPDRDVDKPIAPQKATPSSESNNYITGTAVEQMPVFPGGKGALLEFLSKNVRYPEAARKAKIKGRVVATFIIDEQGRVMDPKIVRSLSPECDEEVLRLIGAMPLWRPALQAGRAVKVRYTLPIAF